jgi:hypothetical protein
VTYLINLIKAVSFEKLHLKIKYLLLVKGFSLKFIEVKILFLLKNQFFCVYTKTTQIITIKPLENLFSLAKLHIFLLLKLYIYPNF